MKKYSCKEFTAAFEAFKDQNKLYRTDGERGVKNLCKIVNAIGYKDPLYFGQHESGSYGDLICFLEDNPGAVDAIHDWINEVADEDWQEKLENQINIIEEDCDDA